MEKSAHEYVVPAPKGHLALTGNFLLGPTPQKEITWNSLTL
jgi:hypothetical protein